MFVNDPVRGWMTSPAHWPIQPLIEKMLNDSNPKLIDYIASSLHSFKSYETDLISGSLKYLSLSSNTTSVVISFKKGCKLALCTGIRFYSDEMALNEIEHIYSGDKNEKSYFEPLILPYPKVYSQFYNNRENIGVQDQASVSNDNKIPVTVFGIDPIWTIAGFLADRVSQIGLEQSRYSEQIKRLIKIYLDWITKPGSYVLKTIAARLVTNMTKRLVEIYNQSGTVITL